MKLFLFLFSILLSSNCVAQKLDKLLTSAQRDSVERGYPVNIIVDKLISSRFDDYQGNIRIIKLNGKLHYYFTGESKRYSANGKVLVIMKSDTLGYIQSYYEVDPKDGLIFNCEYKYQLFNGSLYRLESMRLYYSPNNLMEEGNRYLVVV